MIAVTIDGNPVSIVPSTLSAEDAVEERSVCSFHVVPDLGVGPFAKGQPVQVADGGDVVFGGVVEEAIEVVIAGVSRWELQCSDWHYLADKRIAARSYTAQTAGAIVADLHSRYLAAEGVTLGIVEDGPEIAETVFNYAPVSESLDTLAEKAGVVWKIDAEKVLAFASRGSKVAPWVPTMDEVRNLRIKHGNSEYRNRQYVRGGRDITDPQTEPRQGDGNTRAFTMSYPVARVPTVVVNGVPQTVGIRGLESGRDWYWSKGEPVVSQSDSAAPLAGADLLEVTYEGEFAIVALAEDPIGIADRQTVEGSTTGFVERVVEAAVSSREAAFSLASGKLERYASVGRVATFETHRSGLRGGQVVTFDSELFAGDLLVTSVEMFLSGEQPVYRVEAVEGPVVDSWAKFFTRLNDKPSAIDLVKVGGGDVLALLVSLAERTNWVEIVTPTVHGCPVPSPNLFPAADLFPC